MDNAVWIALIVAVPTFGAGVLVPVFMRWLDNRNTIAIKEKEAELRQKETADLYARQDLLAARTSAENQAILARQEESARKAAVGIEKLDSLAHQVNGLLSDRDKQNIAEGEKKGEKKGADAAAQLAEGQRQGMEIARAGLAAVPTPDGKAPLSVEDDRTAAAGERVANATERSAEAQQRVANVAEEKKPNTK